MKRPIRKKLIRAKLEKHLLKNERRMQRISENSYNIRLALEKLDATEKVALPEPPKEEGASVDPVQ